MRAHDRLRHRRAFLALRLAQGQAVGAGLGQHHVPELREIVHGGEPVDALLHRLRQVVIGVPHALELGVAAGEPAALRHALGMQQGRERDLAAIAHVRVPALAGIGEAHGLAVLDHVGKDHHLGMTRRVKAVGDVDLERAELRGEGGKFGRIEVLARKAQDAALAERHEEVPHCAFSERPRQIDILDPRAQHVRLMHDVHGEIRTRARP